MEEQESEKTSNRFRKREKAPASSFGWRWLFPAFLLAAVIWSVFLLIESGDVLLLGGRVAAEGRGELHVAPVPAV